MAAIRASIRPDYRTITCAAVFALFAIVQTGAFGLQRTGWVPLVGMAAAVVIGCLCTSTSIAFSADAVSRRTLFGVSSITCRLDGRTRLEYVERSMLTRWGRRRRGVLELQCDAGRSVIALPDGVFSKQREWAALLLQAVDRGRLSAAREARERLLLLTGRRTDRAGRLFIR